MGGQTAACHAASGRVTRCSHAASGRVTHTRPDAAWHAAPFFRSFWRLVIAVRGLVGGEIREKIHVLPLNHQRRNVKFSVRFFLPEIDDVWIAPPISSGTTVDSKGKSVVNEEEEHNPAPEVSKDTFAKPSGSGQPAPPYGDLPAKFEKFCSQFDSQRSEDIPDMFSDPESVQKIQFATSLLAGITQQANNFDCGVHVLYIITKMIEAEKNGKLLEYLEKGGLPVEWGTAEIVANYRQEVRDFVHQLSRK
ncbi:hypothetical protein R1sor_011278 [Riccia sorocarpa]|uniref:Ubiquitin-like protease family profile domain-containing protein n=1 Tax=Riccia sorocarpa TaxID=122646 RepID=A0ABD3I0F5_9MARC